MPLRALAKCFLKNVRTQRLTAGLDAANSLAIGTRQFATNR